MEKNGGYFKAPETEFLVQWGNRKRLRGPRVKDLELSEKINGGIRRKIISRIDRLVVTASDEKETSQFYQPSRITRNCESVVLRSNARENKRKSLSPEKEDRYYTTRGSMGSGGSGGGGGCGENDNGKISPPADGNGGGVEKKRGGVIWPKLYISLSTKEKVEDFMAMKGCKPSHRPKKRAKMIQRRLLWMQLVSPGGWLSDMSYERYEVKEKKTSISKKKPRGLKAMGSMESDSE